MILDWHPRGLCGLNCKAALMAVQELQEEYKTGIPILKASHGGIFVGPLNVGMAKANEFK